MPTNTFDGGMNRDTPKAFTSNKTYHTALNMTFDGQNHRDVGLVNELGNKLSAEVDGDIIGATLIEQTKQAVIFVAGESSQIHLFDLVSKKLTYVVSDAEIGGGWDFSKHEFMYAEIKEHNACDDLLIYFSSNCHYHVVNISEMVDPVRRKNVIDNEDSGYFDIIQPVTMPKLNVTPVSFANSTLESGSVAFAVQLVDDDGNESNFFPLSNTVSIKSRDNIPGQPATNAVEVYMSGLDRRYEKVRIAVVKTSAGQTNVALLPPVNYSGGTYSFIYYGQSGFPADIASITTQTKAYIRGRDLLQHDGRLFLYNIQRTKNVNYQSRANKIVPKAVVYQVSLGEQLKYKLPTMPRGENVAPGIVLQYCDGTFSKAFGIFGQGVSGNSVDFNPEEDTQPYEYEFDGEEYIHTAAEETDAPEGEQPLDQIIREGSMRGEVVRKRGKLTVKGVKQRPLTFGAQSTVKRNDPWVDADGRDILTETPVKVYREYNLSPAYSTLDFPDTKDCYGERLYPEGKVFSYHIPGADKIPHYTNYNQGVFNNFQPVNDPYKDIKINIIGMKFENIELPSADELPKPLDPKHPYKIVWIKRGSDNSTVIANGFTSGTCIGENRDEKFYFQRHGLNSKDNVFRGVSSKRLDVSGNVIDEDSRFAEPDKTKGYLFHSPDTDLIQGRLDATKVVHNFNLQGAGWRYGIYATGKEAADSWTGQRIDQRGARIANNITGIKLTGPAKQLSINNITPTTTGEVIVPTGNRTLPVDSVYNESSVFLETNDFIPGNEPDNSFIGDTLEHQGALFAHSAYVTLKREIPDQYGGVENRSYIDLGLIARTGQTSVEGICGDMYIGPYSKRRTSFVSEKVGEGWGLQGISLDAYPDARKTVCDTNDDRIFKLLGLDINQQGPPESSDDLDPRNYAGLYTTPPPFTLAKNNKFAYDADGPLTDVYYPGTVTGVVYSIVESRVPAWERITGDPEMDHIFAEKLNGKYLDSNVSEEKPWEECYLNNVNYVPVVQPSRKQVSLIATIKGVVMLLIPATMLANISDVDGVFDAISTSLANAGLATLFSAAATQLFTKDVMRKLVGLPPCIGKDSEGAYKTFKSERHKDNYNEFNLDLVKQTTENQYLGPNSLYNTCDCSDCSKDDLYQRGGETSKEIYYTAKQKLDTEIDSYRNLKIAAYGELPVHAGNIRKLFIQQNNLYAHTTKGIWTLQLAVGNWPADIGSQLTGAGELLMRPAMLFETGGGEGFAGTNHPNAAINVPGWGYFFIDDVARKVYRFNGKPEEISGYGMGKFFEKHLPFCDPTGIYDENYAPSYTLGWDHQFRRLLLTKLDTKGSFTISYNPMGERGRWVSFHSYTPNMYLWDRYDLFSIRGGEIWEHNVSGLYQEYYGVKEDAIIELTMNNREGELNHFTIEAVDIYSEASRDNGTMLPTTFTEALFYNYKSSSGSLSLNLVSRNDASRNSQETGIKENSSVVKINEVDDVFRINTIRDRFDLRCDEFVNIKDEDECSVIDNIEHKINCLIENTQVYKQRSIGGRYINLKLVYRDTDNTELKTFFIKWKPAE